MKKLKYVKLFESFNKINEKYGELKKFYHKTSTDFLDSFKKGIDINLSSERGQGSGFYVFNDLSYIKPLPIIKGSHHKGYLANQDCIIEIEAVLNETNFDIDYELVKNLPELISSVVDKSNIKSFTIKNNHDDEFVIITNENLNQNDFKFSQPDDNLGGWIWKIESDKSDKFAYYKKGFVQEVGDVSQIKEYIDSFDRIGLKNEIEKLVYQNIDNQPTALRYVGPKIIPTRYMNFENGEWSDWKNI